MEERRRSKRDEAWFPMRLETTEGGERLAVSRNVSETGLLIATTTRLEVGAPIKITYREEPEDEEDHIVEGRIVRFERNEDDPKGLWPFMVAVEFSKPSTSNQ